MNELPRINRLSLEWYDAKGQCHRERDLPAVVIAYGSISYWKNGQLHRDGDSPAVVYLDGSVEYFKNGKRYKP